MHDAFGILLGLLTSPLARALAIFVLALQCLASPIIGIEGSSAGPEQAQSGFAPSPPRDVVVFDLHDPVLMSDWALFLEQTPMLNEQPLPQYLQDRLTNVVGVYRAVTTADQPAFFVATYFDVLANRLLVDGENDIWPLRTCPVFTNGANASVSSLLAVASGLPDELFANAPGSSEGYHYLMLHTEYSHCKFLAAMQGALEIRTRTPLVEHDSDRVLHLSFTSRQQSFTACVSEKEELRALLETVGDVDAVSLFRSRAYDRSMIDEADVFAFVRLLALLATDAKGGYAAIPVLYPILNEPSEKGIGTHPGCLQVADALAFAYDARAAFRRLVPFSIHDADSLSLAKQLVMAALSESAEYSAVTDERLNKLLNRFVVGADLLLAPSLVDKKMPPVVNWRHPVTRHLTPGPGPAGGATN